MRSINCMQTEGNQAHVDAINFRSFYSCFANEAMKFGIQTSHIECAQFDFRNAQIGWTVPLDYGLHDGVCICLAGTLLNYVCSLKAALSNNVGTATQKRNRVFHCMPNCQWIKSLLILQAVLFEIRMNVFQHFGMPTEYMRLTNLVIIMMILMHWNGCLQYMICFVTWSPNFPDDVWIAIDGLNASISSIVRLWFSKH